MIVAAAPPFEPLTVNALFHVKADVPVISFGESKNAISGVPPPVCVTPPPAPAQLPIVRKQSVSVNPAPERSGTLIV